MEIAIDSKRLTAFACYTTVLLPAAASAAALEEIPGVPSKPLDEVLGDITSWLITFAILLCVLVIIYGGVNYVASVGDEERIKKSKKAIHYAVWGLLLIGLSYAMIEVVNDVLT